MLGLQQGLVHFLESQFASLGCSVARHPVLFIVPSLLLTAALTVSMTMLGSKEEDQQSLWLPKDSEYMSNVRFINEHDPVYTVSETVLMVAEDNLLTPDNLVAMMGLRDEILALATANASWNQMCTTNTNKLGSSKLVNNGNVSFPTDLCPLLTTQTDNNDSGGEEDVVCMESHILELFLDVANLESLSQEDILEIINTQPTVSKLTGENLHLPSLLGGIERDGESNRIIGAKATVLAFSLDKLRSSASSLKELEWSFLNATLSRAWGSDLKAFPSASRSAGDLMGDDVENDLSMMLYGYLLVMLYVMLALGQGLSCIGNRAPLSLMGIVVVIMGFVSSNGTCALLGLKSSDMNSILPFLLLGIGIDDMFVIVQSYDNLRGSDVSARETLDVRVGEAMRHAGMAILITSLTDVLAFGVGSTTVLPALQSFCIYTAIAIFYVFGYMCTFFLPCFVLDQRRMESRRNALLCCLKHDDDSVERSKEKQDKGWLAILFNWYATLLSKWPIKLILLMAATILLACSTYNMTLLETDFRTEWFLPRGSYLREYLHYWDKHFPSNGDRGVIYVANVDVNNGSVLVLDIIELISKDMVEENNLAEGSGRRSFMVDLVDYVNDDDNQQALYPRNRTLNAATFDLLLAKFLWTTDKGLGSSRSLVRFEEEPVCSDQPPEIKVQLIPYTHQRFETSLESVSKMKSLQTSLSSLVSSSSSTARVFAHSTSYSNLLTLDIITSELLRNILLALLCVFLCTLLLIGHIFTCLLVTLNVMLTLIHVAGFMHLWQLTVDTISALLLTIAMGLAVDYSAHVAHAFVVQDKGLDRNTKMINALCEMGPAVLNGGFSTFLAFCLLASAKSFIFVTFFKLFFLVVAFGLFQGLLILPIVLSIVGPSQSSRTLTQRRKNTVHVASAIHTSNMNNSWGEGGHVATSADEWATSAPPPITD